MSPVEDLKAPSPHAGEQPKSVSPPLTAPPKAPPSAPSLPSAPCVNRTPDTGLNVASTAAADTTVVSSLPADCLPNPGAVLTTSQSAQKEVPQSQNQNQISGSQMQNQISGSQMQNQNQISGSQMQNQISGSQMQNQNQISGSQMQNQISGSQMQNQISGSQMQNQNQISGSQMQNQISGSQMQNQISVPQMQNQISVPQMQNQSQAAVPHSQVFLPHVQASVSHQAQSELVSLQQIQVQPLCPPSKPQSEPVQSSHQSPMPSSTPQTSDQLHPHPPHPSQVPLPSQSLSSVTIPSLPTQTPTTDTQTEAPPLPVPPGSPAHPVVPPPSHPPQFQPVPGTVPLQQLSQLYLDPLYPGFPQKDNGEPALPPPYSTNKSGDDLPQDVSILRFFFNLGVKAYSMPMFYPYVYLFPLQHAYNVQPKPPSRSPSPTPLCHPSGAPPGHHEPYPSVSRQFDRSSPQAPPAEPAPPTEGAYTQGGYPPLSQPPSCTLPCPPPLWHQPHMQTHRNPSYPVVYPSPQLLSYPTPPPTSQCYPPSLTLGHPMHPPAVAQYSSVEFQSSAGPEVLQVNQDQNLQPANGEAAPGLRSAPGPGPQEGAASANVANENSGRPAALPGVSDFGHPQKEEGDRLTRPMFAVDPSHSTPVVMAPGPQVLYNFISKSTVPDNNPSHSYRSHHKPANHSAAFPPLGGAEVLSVSCSTEDDWDEPNSFRQPALNYRAQRKSYRGRGGRGGGSRRRHAGEGGPRFNHTQYIYRPRQRTYYEEGHPQM
uniref:OTU deubiquitinase 4 n=1 Tax=Sphaeramia orbicularis TaxID=375764 RepID=A0A673ACH0_9TELE